MQLIQFLLPFLASSSLVAGAALKAPLNPNVATIVNSIKDITASTQKLTTAVVKLDQVSADTNVYEPVNAVIHSTSLSVEALNSFLEMEQPINNAADQKQVCDAHGSFISALQNFLSHMIIKKSKIASAIHLLSAAQSLRSVGKQIDSVSSVLGNKVSTCGATIHKNTKALDETFEEAICAYTPGSKLIGSLCKVVALETRSNPEVASIVNKLNTMTDLTQQLTQTINETRPGVISLWRSTLDKVFKTIIRNEDEITQIGQTTNSAMKTATPITNAADQQPVCRAVHNYIKVSQVLLNTVMSKSAIMSSPLLPAVAQSLRGAEVQVQELASGLKTFAPECNVAEQENMKTLTAQFEKVICASTNGLACKILGSDE